MKLNADATTDALRVHNHIIRIAQWANFGAIIEQEGDSYTVVFHEALDAVKFCLQVWEAAFLGGKHVRGAAFLVASRCEGAAFWVASKAWRGVGWWGSGCCRMTFCEPMDAVKLCLLGVEVGLGGGASGAR
eukprot:77274-Chlamydomonas_euryale.AAC.1